MSGLILTYEPFIRFAAFASVFVALAAWELLAPRREQQIPRSVRWPSNIGVVLLDTVLVRVIVPTTVVALALVCEARGWGLLQIMALPAWATIGLGFIAMDAAIYLQHVMFHAIPALWRFHRMHHADQEIDVTTGVRFHPIEILMSLGIKFGVVAALGVPAVSGEPHNLEVVGSNPSPELLPVR